MLWIIMRRNANEQQDEDDVNFNEYNNIPSQEAIITSLKEFIMDYDEHNMT